MLKYVEESDQIGIRSLRILPERGHLRNLSLHPMLQLAPRFFWCAGLAWLPDSKTIKKAGGEQHSDQIRRSRSPFR